MFDIWLRAFWRTFLWWLPGADDSGETNFGKREAERSESTRTAQESGGSSAASQPQRAPSADAPAESGASTRQAAPAQPETKTASGATAKPKSATAETTARTASGKGAGSSAKAQAKATGKGKDTANSATDTTAGTKAASAPASKTGSKATAGGESEDLTVIKGIGPTLANRLHGLGITSMRELASADPDRVAEQLDSRPVTPERVRQWIDDAKSRVAS